MKGLLLYTILFGLVLLMRPAILLDTNGQFKSIEFVQANMNKLPMSEIVQSLPGVGVLIAILVAIGAAE